MTVGGMLNVTALTPNLNKSHKSTAEGSGVCCGWVRYVSIIIGLYARNR